MSWLSKILGLGKPDTNYGGQQPYMSIGELTGGKDLLDMYTARSKGQDVGIPEPFWTRATSPVIAQRMARWEETEQPAMSQALSSRGIGYSPLSADVERRAVAGRERDIQEYLGQTALESERIKRQEIADALSSRSQLASMEAGMQQARSAAERGVWGAQTGIKEALVNRGQQAMQYPLSLGMTAANIYSAANQPDYSKIYEKLLGGDKTTPVGEATAGGTYAPRSAFSNTSDLYGSWMPVGSMARQTRQPKLAWGM